MSIPRLQPSAQPLEVTITVSTQVRPYFTEWYQEAKEDEETPEQFALRHLKDSAINWYAGREISTVSNTGQDDLNSVVQDADVLKSEF